MKKLKLKSSKTKNETKNQFLEEWKKRITEEKGCTENTAEHIALRVKALAEYMLYGHAVIAFYKQDGTFQLVTGTLINYSREFHHSFNIQQIHSAFVFWCVEAGAWRTFQIENLLDWKEFV